MPKSAIASSHRALPLIACAAALGTWLVSASPATAEDTPAVSARPPGAVTALGRLEPKDGVLRVAGPSLPAVVIQELVVSEGDSVEEGQVIAVLDAHASKKAIVDQLQAELSNVEQEIERKARLRKTGVLSASEWDAWQLRQAVAKAKLEAAEAELALCSVRSPIRGQVLEIHSRTGERVGPLGIAELARTHEMYAIAEVYETDIRRVKIGQRATVSSPALDGPIEGNVERIGLKIGKMDVLDTDPAAKTDARVVEVEIRLADSAAVADLTNLQVEVAIEP